jgi:hypothetical protein
VKLTIISGSAQSFPRSHLNSVSAFSFAPVVAVTNSEQSFLLVLPNDLSETLGCAQVRRPAASLGMLRASYKRPRHRRAAKQRDELAPFHCQYPHTDQEQEPERQR